MDVKPDYKTIGSLFGDRNVFKIPTYQRGYAWEKEHVEDFIDDLNVVLNSDDSEHFYGCFVCAQEERIGGNEQWNELIDGQQRLTTFLILVRCMLDKYQEVLINDTYKEYVESKIKSLTERYFVYPKVENRKTEYVRRLSLSRKDDSYFNRIIEGHKESAGSESHKRISRCYAKLKDFIESICASDDIDFVLDKLQLIENALNEKCNVIHLITSNVADAYKLFQTINDRGQALSQADLIRAKSLGISDKKGSEYYFKELEKIWDNLDLLYGKDLEKYLGYYLVSTTGEKVKRTSFYDQFMSLILEKGRISPEDIHKRFKVIEASLNDISKIVNGEWPFESANLSRWHQNRLEILISNLQHTHSLPLLLAAKSLNEKNFYLVVRVVEIFFYRFKLLCNNKIDPATSIYHFSCKEINNGRFDLQKFKSSLRLLLENSATKEQIEKNLSTLQYSRDKKLIKYFLLGVEESWRWIEEGKKGGFKSRESSLDTSKVYDFKTMTLEHIYPQNATLSNQKLENLKHKIGNLTLLDPSLNSSIGNIEYEKKRHQLTAGSSVQMNKIFHKYDTWDDEKIIDRQNLLLGHADEVFCF